jgi:ankyrin repeat protein
MPMKLTESEVKEIQERYPYLTNFDDDDLIGPIDPVSYKDSNGDTLLHIAARLGDLRTIQMLLSAGLNIDQTGDMSCTALHYAQMKGHSEVVKYLLDQGASKTVINDFGKLPLDE